MSDLTINTCLMCGLVMGAPDSEFCGGCYKYVLETLSSIFIWAHETIDLCMGNNQFERLCVECHGSVYDYV